MEEILQQLRLVVYPITKRGFSTIQTVVISRRISEPSTVPSFAICQATRSSRPCGMIGSVMKGWGWSAKTWSIKYLVSLQFQQQPRQINSDSPCNRCNRCNREILQMAHPSKLDVGCGKNQSQEAWLAIDRPNFSPDLHQVCNSWAQLGHNKSCKQIHSDIDRKKLLQCTWPGL